MNPARKMRHDPHTGVQIRIGVMGSANEADSAVIAGLCRAVGRAIAEKGFAIAYEEGKLVGVLTGTGGITEALAAVTAALRKDTGAQVIYDSEPTRLIDHVLERYSSDDYRCPGKPDLQKLQ